MIRLEYLFETLLAIAGLSLPFLVPNVHGKLLVALVIIGLITKPRFLEFTNSVFFLFSILFFFQLFGIVYSKNMEYAFSYIETSVALFAIPITLLGKAPRLSFLRVGKMFLIGVITLNILSLFFISYDLWDYENLQSNLIAANNIIVSIHPTLLSMYISFCIFFLTDRYFPLHQLDRIRLGWVLFSLAVLIVFLLWLNSRAGILAFLLASIFFVGYRWQGRTRIIGYASLVLFVIILVSIPFSNYRFVQAPKLVLEGDIGIDHLDPNVFPLENRLQILKCNIELLKWPEIVYGYGTGDGRDELQKCFAANNYSKPLAQNMDSHSEYFAQLHRHGIIGLGLFLALLFVPFRHALRYKSPLLGAFIILFAVTAMFENVLSVQKGVTFFALFCPLLWLYAKDQFEIKAPTGPAEIPAQKA
ncbi:MAG: O-antigen ligase family protein [Cyclobacteriaceae bacterium]